MSIKGYFRSPEKEKTKNDKPVFIPAPSSAHEATGDFRTSPLGGGRVTVTVVHKGVRRSASCRCPPR